MVSSAMQPGEAVETDTAGAVDTGGSSQSNAAVPPAPAVAMPSEQEGSATVQSASETMAELAPVASPTVAPTETATPVPTATASPAPPSPSPTPAERASGNGASISRWRVAEFGLLLLLVWLGVTWFGRTRVGNHSSTDETDTKS
jgi:hypothetical protein